MRIDDFLRLKPELFSSSTAPKLNSGCAEHKKFRGDTLKIVESKTP